MVFADITRLGLALPETQMGTSYGTPALKVRGKLLARLKEDGSTMVLCAVDQDERALLIEMTPSVFHVTEHYQRYPTVLIRVKEADPVQMAALLVQSWRRLASPRCVKAFDAPGR